MSLHLLTNVLLGIALVVYVGSKQLRWRRVDRTSVWRLPAILGILGLVNLSSAATTLAAGPVDVALIAVELVLAVAVGLVMGRITTFRAAAPDAKGVTIEAKTGGAGMALWIGLIAFRIGLDVVGGLLGAHLLTATGVILLTVAANRAAAAFVVDARLPRAVASRA
ncbi:hypothetical protein [Frondihabitans sp. Leaf304]|uniref:hypothetical protein n=1 Tax=Frondihabitans sp. Leaf304 TaxID=1736329 RepID=UPI0006F9EA9C|nr:hypothetical protein [Frondihabitans sp. Leaf304]KQQ25697.1 hypothetical protein ASF54_15020 [Frondihabitans sp. Leaf304]